MFASSIIYIMLVQSLLCVWFALYTLDEQFVDVFPGSRSSSESVDFKLFPTSTWNLESTHCDNWFEEDLHETNNNRKTASNKELKLCEADMAALHEHRLGDAGTLHGKDCKQQIVNNKATE